MDRAPVAQRTMRTSLRKPGGADVGQRYRQRAERQSSVAAKSSFTPRADLWTVAREPPGRHVTRRLRGLLEGTPRDRAIATIGPRWASRLPSFVSCAARLQASQRNHSIRWNAFANSASVSSKWTSLSSSPCSGHTTSAPPTSWSSPGSAKRITMSGRSSPICCS